MIEKAKVDETRDVEQRTASQAQGHVAQAKSRIPSANGKITSVEIGETASFKCTR